MANNMPGGSLPPNVSVLPSNHQEVPSSDLLLPKGVLDWANEQSREQSFSPRHNQAMGPASHDFNLLSGEWMLFKDLHDEGGRTQSGIAQGETDQQALQLLLEASARLTNLQPSPWDTPVPAPRSEANSSIASHSGSFTSEAPIHCDFNQQGGTQGQRGMMALGGLDVNTSGSCSGMSSPGLSPGPQGWNGMNSFNAGGQQLVNPLLAGMGNGPRTHSKLRRGSATNPRGQQQFQQHQQQQNLAQQMAGLSLSNQQLPGVSSREMEALLGQFSMMQQDPSQHMGANMMQNFGNVSIPIPGMSGDVPDMQPLNAMMQMLQSQGQGMGVMPMPPLGGDPITNQLNQLQQLQQLQQVYSVMQQAQGMGLNTGFLPGMPNIGAPSVGSAPPDYITMLMLQQAQAQSQLPSSPGPGSPHVTSGGVPGRGRQMSSGPCMGGGEKKMDRTHSASSRPRSGSNNNLNSMLKPVGGEGDNLRRLNMMAPGVRDLTGCRSLGGSFSHRGRGSDSPTMAPGSPVRNCIGASERSHSFSSSARREWENNPASDRSGNQWFGDSGSGAGAGGSARHRSDVASDPLLQDLRNGRNLELSEATGHLVAFTVDQHGSRFIQQKLVGAPPEVLNGVLMELQPKCKMISMDIFGNYVIQKLLDVCCIDQRRQLVDALRGHIMGLSLHCYGCRVVQKALEVLPLDWQSALLVELDGQILRCARDQNGNHVVQKVIENMPLDSISHVLEDVLLCAPTMSCHPFGSRVIQRVLEKCPCEHKTRAAAVKEVIKSACLLAQDQFGNYVLQHVLEYGAAAERLQVAKELASQMLMMSTHKFASNVVEKCMMLSNGAERDVLIESVLSPYISKPEPRQSNSSGQSCISDEECSLQVMMKDPFGNYVVRKMMELSNESQLEVLMECLIQEMRMPHRSALVVERLEKLAVAGGRLQATLRQGSAPQQEQGGTDSSGEEMDGSTHSPSGPLPATEQPADPNGPASARKLTPANSMQTSSAHGSFTSAGSGIEDVAGEDATSLSATLPGSEKEKGAGNSSTPTATQDLKLSSPRAAGPDSVGECSDSLCVICGEGPRESGFIHGESAHIVACRKCVKGLPIGAPCPMCQEPVEHILSNIFKC